MLTGPSLLKEIDVFLARSGMKHSRFGRLAIGETTLCARLRNGGSVRLERAQKIMRFILLTEIEGYLRREKISEDRLSFLALGNAFHLKQIRDGDVISPALADQLLAFIRQPHPAARHAESASEPADSANTILVDENPNSEFTKALNWARNFVGE